MSVNAVCVSMHKKNNLDHVFFNKSLSHCFKNVSEC